MPNRLKQLPLNVQKRVYEMAGMAGTSCGSFDSTEHNQAMTAFLSATSGELQDFLYDHARYNLEHRISWYDTIQEVYGTSRQRDVYREYLRSPEWQRKRQAVLNRAKFNSIMTTLPGHPIKPICEHVECSNVAKDVHHWNYERVGKEYLGMEPEKSEENDLIALCRECHASLHAEGSIKGIHNV